MTSSIGDDESLEELNPEVQLGEKLWVVNLEYYRDFATVEFAGIVYRMSFVREISKLGDVIIYKKALCGYPKYNFKGKIESWKFLKHVGYKTLCPGYRCFNSKEKAQEYADGLNSGKIKLRGFKPVKK